MSNLSEEEIIEELNSLSPSENAIEGILSLYNKEKEKNKILENKEENQMKQDIINKHIKNLEEITELVKEEIENDNENISAILDLEDLKSLKCLLDLYNQFEQGLIFSSKQIKYIEDNFVKKDKIKELEDINDIDYLKFEIKNLW